MFHRVDNSPSLVDGDIEISLCSNNQFLNLEKIYLPPPERKRYYIPREGKRPLRPILKRTYLIRVIYLKISHMDNNQIVYLMINVPKVCHHKRCDNLLHASITHTHILTSSGPFAFLYSPVGTRGLSRECVS